VACGLQFVAQLAVFGRSKDGERTMSVETPHRKPTQIVVGFDFSPLAERAFEQALELASRAPTDIHVVTVAQTDGALVRLPGEAEPVSEELARETVRLRVGQLVEEYRGRKGPIMVDRVALYVLSGLPVGDPARLLVDLANEVDADLIVVGTHGRSGVARLMLGSVAQQVVRDASTSVYVVRPADFVGGKKVPEIEPPLPPGAPHLRHFEHRRVYHYIDKVASWTHRTMPVS
jgi:nucleotide-binding universal stress UspA family protein